MRKMFYRMTRRWPRALRHMIRRWAPPAPRSAEPDLTPSPGVAAFLGGETIRQVAYFVGAADPGIIDPHDDWPGALADAHAVIRSYITRLQEAIKEQS